MPAPRRHPRSELAEAYGAMYDPDEGTRGPRERQRHHESGADTW